MVSVFRFTAKWCGPCKQYAPVFDKWATANNLDDVFVIDVDDAPDIVQEYKVSAVPTTIFFKDGKEVFRNGGALTKQQLDDTLKHVSNH